MFQEKQIEVDPFNFRTHRTGGSWEGPTGREVWSQGRVWGVYVRADGNAYVVDGGGSLRQDTAPDVIFAGDSDDQIVGGLGDDTLDGGLNNDILWGHGGDGDDPILGDGTLKSGYYSTPGGNAARQ